MSVVIKTRSGTGAPSSLVEGELAVDTTNANLYVGSAINSVLTINPIQVPAGTLDSQSLYWDNTAAQWTANSNILLTSSGTLTATGGIINSAIGATGPSTGAFTTLTTTETITVGTTLTATGGITNSTIGASSPSTGAFTDLVATTIGAASQGTGKFTTLEATNGIIASAIGASSPSTGAFTTLEASGNIKSTSGTGQFYGAGSRDSNTVIGSATSPSSWTTDAVNTVLIGKGAGVATTSGGGNVLIGTDAGKLLATGSGNTIIGTLAGFKLPAGSSGNVLIGAGTWDFSNGGNAVNDTVLISGGSLATPQTQVERLKIDASGAEINGGSTLKIDTNSAEINAGSTLKIDASGAEINGDLRVGKFGIVPKIYASYQDLPADGSGQVQGEMAMWIQGSELYGLAFWDQTAKNNQGQDSPVWKYEILSSPD